MMHRRTFVAAAAGIAAVSTVAGAQPARGRLPVIGFLNPNSQSVAHWQRLLAAFHRGLKDRGHQAAGLSNF